MLEYEERCLRGCPQVALRRWGKHCVSALTHSLPLLASGLSAFVICHLALSENGHLTKTRTVGHAYCSAATC